VPFCASCSVDPGVFDGDFCSDSCRDHTEAARTDFLAGLEQPFATGWKLWASSLSTLVQQAAPIAVAAAVLWQLAFPVTAVLLALFGVTLTRTILLQRHAQWTYRNPYSWAARRFVPWVGTVACATALAVISLGFIGIRLLWADEFSLIRRAGPVESLKESWYLTSNVPFDDLYLAQLFIEVPKLVMLAAAAFLAVAYPFPPMGNLLHGFIAGLGFVLVFLGYSGLYATEVARFYGLNVARARRELHGAY